MFLPAGSREVGGASASDGGVHGSGGVDGFMRRSPRLIFLVLYFVYPKSFDNTVESHRVVKGVARQYFDNHVL